MSIMRIKFLNCNGAKALVLASHSFQRMTSTGQPCPPHQTESSKPKEPCPPHQTESSKQKEPCPPKIEPCPPPPTPTSTCPNQPPCPPIPQCPPTICPPILDTNDPCNYTPPPCPDPERPDLTRLKKLQCLFQEDNNIPLYLKKGNSDAFIFQAICIITLISFATALYNVYLFGKK